MSRRRPGTGVPADITGKGAGQEPNNAMEVKLMETTMNNIRPDTSNPIDDVRQHSAASRPAGRPDDDVVRWREFRQAQWLVGIALAAILGSQGFLYAAIMDLQRDMHTQFSELSGRVHELSERVTRIETRLDMDADPSDPAG